MLCRTKGVSETRKVIPHSFPLFAGLKFKTRGSGFPQRISPRARERGRGVGALCGATTSESPSRESQFARQKEWQRASARLPGTLARSRLSPLFPSSPSAPPFPGGKQSRPPAGRRLEAPRPSCRASYWSRLSTFHAGFKNGPGQPGREERKGSAGWPRLASAARRRLIPPSGASPRPAFRSGGDGRRFFGSDFGAAGMEPFF